MAAHVRGVLTTLLAAAALAVALVSLVLAGYADAASEEWAFLALVAATLASLAGLAAWRLGGVRRAVGIAVAVVGTLTALLVAAQIAWLLARALQGGPPTSL